MKRTRNIAGSIRAKSPSAVRSPPSHVAAPSPSTRAALAWALGFGIVVRIWRGHPGLGFRQSLEICVEDLLQGHDRIGAIVEFAEHFVLRHQ